MPLILVRHGCAGTRHRGFLPSRNRIRLENFVYQCSQLGMVVAAITLWRLFDGVRVQISGFELAVCVVIHLVRAATVAIKYAFYTEVEYARMDAPDLTLQEVGDKLILVGWLRPSKLLLLRELERSIVRTNPRAYDLSITFPDDAAHAQAMEDLADHVGDFQSLETCAKYTGEFERIGGCPTVPTKLVLWALFNHDYVEFHEEGICAASLWYRAYMQGGTLLVVLSPLVARAAWAPGTFADAASILCMTCMALSNWIILRGCLGFLFIAAKDAARRWRSLEALHAMFDPYSDVVGSRRSPPHRGAVVVACVCMCCCFWMGRGIA